MQKPPKPTMTSKGQSRAPVDTRDAILNSAESLMSQRGYTAVSLRQIAREAGVNLSSVTHFFKTKENLLAAIYERHTRPMNARRKELLQEAMRISNIDERLAAIVRAFILPAFSSSTANGGGIRFTRLRGMMSMEGHPAAKKIIATSFDATSKRFANAIAETIPGSDRTSILWRGHFLLGALYYSLITPERIDRLTGEPGTGSDHDRAIDELVRATVASLKELETG